MSDYEPLQPAQSPDDSPAMELAEGVKQRSSQQSMIGRLIRGTGYSLLILAAALLLALSVYPDLASDLPLLSEDRSLHSHWARERARRRIEQEIGDEGRRPRSARREIKDAIEKLGGKWNSTTDTVQLDRTEVADSDLKLLQQIPILLELRLSDTQITDAGLVHVAEIETLRDLDLTNTPVTDAGVKHITKVPRLRSLILEGTQVSDETIEVLKQVPELQKLDLTRTQISDAGLGQLNRFKWLRALTVSLDPPTEAAVEQLKQALPDCRVVVQD